MKYIIKNCPALRWDRKKFKICHDRNANTKCEDCFDCLLKQIVELCKKEPQNIVLIDNGCAYGTEENKAYYLAQDILKHLEIEEVE